MLGLEGLVGDALGITSCLAGGRPSGFGRGFLLRGCRLGRSAPGGGGRCASRVFSGVTEGRPHLDLCQSHGGGITSVILSKLRKLAERRLAAPARINEPGALERALNRTWFDCYITGDAELSLALEQRANDRLVYATDFGT